MPTHCEYLQGRDQEDEVHYGYSTPANCCLSHRRLRRRWWRRNERHSRGPSRARQEAYCLLPKHIDCPYYPAVPVVARAKELRHWEADRLVSTAT